MLILWLRSAILFLAKLIIPAPEQRTRIDVSALCPSCGHPSSTIKTVKQAEKLFIEHHCETCDGRWYEEPINAAGFKIEPSPKR